MFNKLLKRIYFNLPNFGLSQKFFNSHMLNNGNWVYLIETIGHIQSCKKGQNYKSVL